MARVLQRAEVVEAVRRRWRVIVFTTLSGLAVALFVGPTWGVRDFEADHVLTPASPGTAADPFVPDLEAIAALASSDRVAARLAAEIGFDGDPRQIVHRVTASADADAGTITVTARRRDSAEEAVVLADLVAGAVVNLVAEDAPEGGALSTLREGEVRELSPGGVAGISPAAGWFMLTLLLGMAGAGLAILSERLDGTVQGRARTESATGLPVLAVVPPVGDAEDPARLHVAEGGSPIALAHTELVDALDAVLPEPEAAPAAHRGASFMVPVDTERQGRVVLVTSPTADEGKTDTVANLAAAFGADGRTVLIVDHDLDATDGGDGGGHLGVRDLLAGRVSSVRDLIQATPIPHVSVVPAGRNPGGHERGTADDPALLDAARRHADVVVVHAPGVLAGADGPVLAASADAVVIVCRSGSTQVRDLRAATSRLDDVGAWVAGVVVVDEAAAAAAGAAVRTTIAALRRDGDTAARRRLSRSGIEWAGALTAMFVLFFLLRAFVFQSFTIPTGSMEPYLEPGARILVSKLSYRFGDIDRGDVVVFGRPPGPLNFGADHLVKRVVGLPGEVIESRDGRVFINGRELAEPYLPGGTRTDGIDSQRIPEDSYWMLGDNRGNSADSRYFGPIRGGSVVGRAFFHVWPPPIGVM